MSVIEGNPAAVSGDLLDRFSGSVLVADSWGGPWFQVSFLHPVAFNHVIAPEVSSASFVYDYGVVKREPFPFFGIGGPIDIGNLFVRIVASNSFASFDLWQGYIPDSHLALMGNDQDASGEQTITAYGLEYLLTKTKILEAWAVVDRRKADTVQLLDYVPQFNNSAIRGISENTLGNKAPIPVDVGGVGPVWAWKFSNDRAEVQTWNATNWIDNLISWYLKDLGFPLVIGGAIELLDLQEPMNRVDGMTAWESIASVAPRNRGIAFSIRPSYPGTPTLFVSSVFREPFELGGVEYPGNPEVYDLDFDAAIDLDRASIYFTTQDRYREVVVTGDLVRSVFTGNVDAANSTGNVFGKGWTPLQEAEYKLTGITPSGSIWEKRQAYDEARARLKTERERPFTYFVLNPSFSGLVNGTSIFPAIIDDGSVDFDEVVWPANGTTGFMRSLPLPEGEGNPLSSMSDMRRPFGVVKNVGDAEYIIGDEKFRYLHDIRLQGVPSFSLRLVDNEHAVELPDAGHWFALNHWDLGDPADQDKTLVYPQFDYDELLFTVCTRLDQRVKVKLAISENESDPVLRLHVPRAQLWILHPDTIIDLTEEGDPIFATDVYPNPFLRDDTDVLWNVAALAQTWYDRKRTLTRYRVRGLYPHIPVGAMIGVGYTGGYWAEINTIVTKKEYSFTDEPSFTVQTGYANLDVVGMGREGRSSRESVDTRIPESPTLGAVIRQGNERNERIDKIDDNTKNLPVQIGGGQWSGGAETGLHWHDGATSNHSLVLERTTMESEVDPDATRAKLGHYLDVGLNRYCAIRALWG